MKQIVYIIFNPTADHGKAIKHVSQIEAFLDRDNITYKLELTNSSGEAVALAREAAIRAVKQQQNAASGIDPTSRESFEYNNDGKSGSEQGYIKSIVAAGGDGTVNEVINGLMQAKAALGLNGSGVGDKVEFPLFGVVPVGRGNDFAYGARVPHDVEAACRLLHGDTRYLMDVGLVSGGLYPQGRYFGNGIGIGFDTLVGLEAAEVTWIPGFLGYVYGALKMLAVYPRAPYVRITFGPYVDVNEDKKVIEVFSPQISIMNGRRMGGTFYMAPDGDTHDAKLDLCMAKGNLKRWQLLQAIGQYTRGSQSENPNVYIDKASHYEIEALEGGLVCHADGETICTNGKVLKVECIPHALQIMAEPARD